MAYDAFVSITALRTKVLDVIETGIEYRDALAAASDAEYAEEVVQWVRVVQNLVKRADHVCVQMGAYLAVYSPEGLPVCRRAGRRHVRERADRRRRDRVLT